jgi:hypothetical protein
VGLTLWHALVGHAGALWQVQDNAQALHAMGCNWWAPDYVNKSWAHFNGNTNLFQVGSINGMGSSATANYTIFAAGATMQFNGDKTACTR